MVICLIFLGVVALLRVACVPVKCLASVLGASDGNVGVSLVEFVKPRTVHIGFASVPTEVVVVGNEVGNLNVGVVHLAH